MGGLFGGGQTISSSEQAFGALRIQSSAYGYAVPILHGKTRVTANLIYYGDFVAIPHTSSQSSGGKGGGGQVMENTTFTYQTAVALSICEGPINSIGTVWATKKQTSLAELGMSLFVGSYPQSAWGYLSTYHPDKALNYQGTAYAAAGAYDLGSNDSLPNHSFEVDSGMGFNGGIRDANPKDSLIAFVTNPNYGACPGGFPLGDLTQWSNYCVANSIFISPAIVEQKPASDYLNDYAEITNSALVFSEGVLKVIPFGDTTIYGNGFTYTPAITPVYDLSDDNFLGDSNDPVTIKRKTSADAFNQLQVEFLNRSNQYNIEVAEAKDQANIEQFGLLPAPMVKAHWICDAAIAHKVAQLKLQRLLYIRNEYEFKLGWRYCLLEPMDIVTITDPLGLSFLQVRILSTEEDESGEISVVAEEFPFGVAHPALYAYEPAAGANINYNVAAPSILDNAILEAPIQITGGALEVWLGVCSNNSNWGGCDVYVSSDNTTYKRLGSIFGSARMGVLYQVLPAAADPDTLNQMYVDLAESNGTLLSGVQVDADNFRTLSYVDGELISYATSYLLSIGKYQLNYLRRGAYGTPNTSHSIGAKFVRLDDAILKYGYSIDQIGSTIYFKFPSFNIYGGGKESVASVTAHSYTLIGPPLPSNVTGFTIKQSGGAVVFGWKRITDDLPVKGYDIRFGPQGAAVWSNMTPLTESAGGTEMTNASVPPGSWTFAIRARNIAGLLSANLALVDLVVTNESTSIISASESALGWPGTVSNFYKHWTGVLIPADQHAVSYYTSWASFATSLLPTPVSLATYKSLAYDAAYNDSLRVYSLIQSTPMPGYSGTINTSFALDYWLTGSIDPNVWNSWTNGVATLRYLRGELVEVPTTVPAFISAFNINVDAPAGLVRDDGTIGSISAGGTTVTFSKTFHFPPFVSPVYNGVGAFIATATDITTTGCKIHIWSTSGSDVGGGPVSWKAEGV